MTNKNKSRVITLGFILGWVVGGLTLLTGITYFFSVPITSLLFLLIAAIVLPPANQFYLKKYNFEISGALKVILTIVILGLISASEHALTTKNTTSLYEKEYIPVVTLAGHTTKESEPFTIQGDKFKVTYYCAGGLCQAALYRLTTNGSSFEKYIVNEQGATQGETVAYGKGTYYIRSTCTDTFLIIALDYN